MDLKFRFQKQQDARSTAHFQSSRKEANREDAWDKYSRKTVAGPTSNANSPVESRKLSESQKTPLIQPLKGSIHRYYRSQNAPKNQFKHYLSDSNNTFYEQRKQLKLYNFYSSMKYFSGVLLAILLVITIILYFITPFEGICPTNAECRVFVHCFEGFTYDSNLKQCVLSEDLYEQIQTVCTKRIQKVREQWGNNQCEGQTTEGVPMIRLNQILSGVKNQRLKNDLQRKLDAFLNDDANQENLHFSYYSTAGIIVPTTKKYSLYCSLTKFVFSSNFKIGFPLFAVFCVVVLLLVNKVRRNIIAGKIYQELRKRTQAEKMLNISYAKADLQKQYGPINQSLWMIIDSLRTKDRDIAFLQDDFLYWKIL